MNKTVVKLNPKKSPPKNAMVLAAGLGTRMRPITDTMPKPLVKVHSKALIDHGLDALQNVGVEKAVVNIHYLADQMRDHLKDRKGPQIILSDESDTLLDSGGGVNKALNHLGAKPFFLINSDSFWIEGYRPNLLQMAEFWRDEDMDILLMMSSTATAIGYSGMGDFNMDPDGRLERREERNLAPFAYSGAAIINPAIFADVPDGPFSLNLLFDRAIEAGRLFGHRMDGMWLHVGTPEAIREAEEAIARSAA